MINYEAHRDHFNTIILEMSVCHCMKMAIKRKGDKFMRSEFNILSKSIRVLEKRIEYIALPPIVLVLLIFIYIGYFSYVFVIGGVIAGIVLSIALTNFTKEKQKEGDLTLGDRFSKKQINYTLSILFTVIYGLSFLPLLQSFYTKPTLYYVLISLCAGIIGVEILFVKTEREGIANLAKSFFLGLNLFLTNQIVFPYGIGGIDSFGHLQLATYIFNNGHIPAGPIPELVYSKGYSFFPGQHILAVTNSLVTSIDLRTMYFLIGSFLMSLGILLVFILGKKFIDLQFGLIAALIFPCCESILGWASHPDKLAYGLFFSLMCLTLIFYRYKYRKWEFSLLFFVLMYALIFTHQYSTIIFFFIMLSILLTEIFENFKSNSTQSIVPLLLEIYILAFFTHWIYYSSSTFGYFVNIVQAHISAFQIEAAEAITVPMRYDLLPKGIIFLNTLGSGIIMMLSVVGFLQFFKSRSYFKNAILGITLMFFALISVGVILYVSHMGYLLPQRLFVFAEICALVFLIAFAILHLFRMTPHLKSKIPVIALIICLAFFSATSTIAGFETSLFVMDIPYLKVYETSYEHYASQWMMEKSMPKNSTIYVSDSFRSSMVFSTIFEKNFEPLPVSDQGTINVSNIQNNSTILFSKFDCITGVITYYKGAAHIGELEYVRLKEGEIRKLEKYEKKYDNEWVKIYWK